MKVETLEALKGSIVAWEDRAKDNYLRASYENCPLCHLFNRTSSATDDDCLGCPVYERTELQYCEGTPCEQYFDNENSVGVAKREVEFLKSLLPQASENCEVTK